ncbi:MAG: hypothetical protein AAB655_01945 [Patescibacteria group bacterium]
MVTALGPILAFAGFVVALTAIALGRRRRAKLREKMKDLRELRSMYGNP